MLQCPLQMIWVCLLSIGTCLSVREYITSSVLIIHQVSQICLVSHRQLEQTPLHWYFIPQDQQFLRYRHFPDHLLLILRSNFHNNRHCLHCQLQFEPPPLLSSSCRSTPESWSSRCTLCLHQDFYNTQKYSGLFCCTGGRLHLSPLFISASGSTLNGCYTYVICRLLLSLWILRLLSRTFPLLK